MRRKTLSNIIYMGYFLIGIVSFIISPTLPLIIKDFQISVSMAGLVFTGSSLGGFLGAVAGGFLSDIFGRKPLIVIGCMLQFLGFYGATIANIWLLIPMLFFITSLGRGFISVNFNALISDINPHRRGAAFNTLHGIYGMGNLIGPVIAGYILSSNDDWRVIYYGAAILWFLFLLISMFIKYPSSLSKDISNQSEKGRLSALRLMATSPVLIMLFLISFIYNGSATGLIGWINTHLDSMDFPVLIGAGMVSIFYAGLTIGRFTCRAISDRIGYSKVILLCAIGSFIFYPLAIYPKHTILLIIGVFGSGLFLAGLHPTGLAYANSIFTEFAGTVTAILSSSLTLGSMSLPWLIGVVAERGSFPMGFSIGYVAITILIVIAILLIKYESKLDAQVKEGISWK